MLHTHSQKLENWLGKPHVERISREFKDFYWPVPLHGVPGNVRVMPGGDFTGDIAAGGYFNKEDAARSVFAKIKSRAERRARDANAFCGLLDLLRAEKRTSRLASVGAFASIDAVIAAYTGGKGQTLAFTKTGTASNAIGNCEDLWVAVGHPAAGGAGAAAPGGTVHVSTDAGALPFKNLGTANTGHYLNWSLAASVINNSLMLYDRLFSVVRNITVNTVAAVTGVPTRYQSGTAGANDYIGGNFVFPMNPTTVLAATAHNWTVCQYTDQDSTTAQSFPSAVGVSACTVGGIDLAASAGWFMPLATGDVGVKALTQTQNSAAVATGTITFVVGHPIAVNACPIANLACMDDGLYTSLNLTSILDNACLSFLELGKPATTLTAYSGYLRAVSE